MYADRITAHAPEDDEESHASREEKLAQAFELLSTLTDGQLSIFIDLLGKELQ